MRRVLGIFLIALPLAIMIAPMIYVMGWLPVLLIWTLAIVCAGSILLGVKLWVD